MRIALEIVSLILRGAVAMSMKLKRSAQRINAVWSTAANTMSAA